jgi:hypothetical protein
MHPAAQQCSVISNEHTLGMLSRGHWRDITGERKFPVQAWEEESGKQRPCKGPEDIQWSLSSHRSERESLWICILLTMQTGDNLSRALLTRNLRDVWPLRPTCLCKLCGPSHLGAACLLSLTPQGGLFSLGNSRPAPAWSNWGTFLWQVQKTLLQKGWHIDSSELEVHKEQWKQEGHWFLSLCCGRQVTTFLVKDVLPTLPSTGGREHCYSGNEELRQDEPVWQTSSNQPSVPHSQSLLCPTYVQALKPDRFGGLHLPRKALHVCVKLPCEFVLGQLTPQAQQG